MAQEYVDAACSGCGGPVARDNKHGYCHRNPECSRKAYAAAARAYRARQPGERPGRGRGGSYHGRPYEGEMLSNARRRAAKMGIECTITVLDIQIPEFCPILGVKLARGTQTQKNNSPSLDRIRNDKGYIPENIWVISLKANRMKNDATDEELLLFSAWVNSHLGLGRTEEVEVS